jgi:hypothetical protein
MPSKKNPAKDKRHHRRVSKHSPAAPEWTLGLPGERTGSNGTREYQRIKNPQTSEQREKWLEKRDKLTLRAFQVAYKNHQPRKSS